MAPYVLLPLLVESPEPGLLRGALRRELRLPPALGLLLEPPRLVLDAPPGGLLLAPHRLVGEPLRGRGLLELLRLGAETRRLGAPFLLGGPLEGGLLLPRGRPLALGGLLGPPQVSRSRRKLGPRDPDLTPVLPPHLEGPTTRFTVRRQLIFMRSQNVPRAVENRASRRRNFAQSDCRVVGRRSAPERRLSQSLAPAATPSRSARSLRAAERFGERTRAVTDASLPACAKPAAALSGDGIGACSSGLRAGRRERDRPGAGASGSDGAPRTAARRALRASARSATRHRNRAAIMMTMTTRQPGWTTTRIPATQHRIASRRNWTTPRDILIRGQLPLSGSSFTIRVGPSSGAAPPWGTREPSFRSGGFGPCRQRANS